MSGLITAVVVLGAAAAAESRKSRKANARARKVDEKRGKLESQRSAVGQVRQAQIARAQIIQSAENQGVGGSSAAVGGAGSVQSQAGGSIAFAQQIFRLQQSSNRLRESAFSHTGNAQDLSNVASLVATQV